MPYGPYRRRTRYRRRYGGYSYRRQWRARKYRYWSWRRRRPCYRWVRGTRRGGFLFFKRRNRRTFIRNRRRKAFLKWLYRYRYKLPKTIKEYNPPYVRLCKIKGYFPLLYCTGNQISWPFIDPISHTFYGGGISFNDFSLNKLYLENEKQRNTWSISNYGFESARFLGGKITLYRHPNISYMVKYFQGSAIHPEQTYMDIHPAYIFLHRKKVIMASNERVPVRKQFKKKRIRVRRPKAMNTGWYDMQQLGEYLLIRLGTTICDFLHPFQTAVDNKGDFYYTIGYQTPDRRTLPNYKWTYSPFNNLYSAKDINQWGHQWETWGGPINIKLPYKASVNWCQQTFPELAASAMETLTYENYTLLNAFDNCVNRMTATQKGEEQIPRIPAAEQLFTGELGAQSQIKGEAAEKIKKFIRPAYFVSIEGPLNPKKKKLMSEICSCKGVITDAIARAAQEPCEQVIFDSLVAGLPQTKNFVPPFLSYSSHRTYYINDVHTLNHPIFKTPTHSQGFWPGRYNANYDTGKGNIIFGIYLPKDTAPSSSFFKMATTDNIGPGSGSTAQFEAEKFFIGVPYWLVFYGHSYHSFLEYLNSLVSKDFKAQTWENKGFFAIGITTFAAEMVASGPFQNGYSPLRYLGYNADYFSTETTRRSNYRTYWASGTNHPPIDECGNVDEKARIFCLLRDGRNVLYGSSLEGSLLATPGSEPYFCSTKAWGTLDDVAIIGRSGPFVLNPMDPRIQGIINLFATYKFYFQFGGYSPPARKELQDTRKPCKGPREPSSVPHRFRRFMREDDPRYPHHPVQVQSSIYIPERDCSPGGFITNEAWQRLTSELPFSSAHQGLGIHGRPSDNKLFAAYSNLQRRNPIPSPQKEEEEEEYLPDPEQWHHLCSRVRQALQEQEKASAVSHSARRKRPPDPQGIQDTLPDRKRRSLQPSGRPGTILHHLGILQSQQRQLRRLKNQLPQRSVSLSDLSYYLEDSPPHL
ncbi:ORF1 [torque teno Delphinidae virus 23]